MRVTLGFNVQDLFKVVEMKIFKRALQAFAGAH
jgi:hypothetical protein